MAECLEVEIATLEADVVSIDHDARRGERQHDGFPPTYITFGIFDSGAFKHTRVADVLGCEIARSIEGTSILQGNILGCIADDDVATRQCCRNRCTFGKGKHAVLVCAAETELRVTVDGAEVDG